MFRLDFDMWAMQIAHVVSRRGTCPRRQVGCVLFNERGHVLATGYNGIAAFLPHCGEPGSECRGAEHASGEGLSVCEAIHAEANALLQCRDIRAIHAAYVTTEPCRDCTKLLLQTSCKRVVYGAPYPTQSAELWHRAGREWIYLPSGDDL